MPIRSCFLALVLAAAARAEEAPPTPADLAQRAFDLVRGTHGPPDFPAAADLAAKACDEGERDACALWADALALYPTNEKRLAAERPRLEAALKKACEAGHHPSCGRIAALAVALDPALPAATRLEGWHRGCAAKSAIACSYEASLVADGAVDGHPDGAKAIEIARAGCETAVPKACAAWSGRYGCLEALDAAEACVRLGFLIESPGQPWDKSKRERDPAKAATAFRKACELGDSLGCVRVAMQQRDGKAAAGMAAALETLTKACDRLGGKACGALADWSPKLPRARKLALRRRACDGGDDSACEGAFSLVWGADKPLDIAQALGIAGEQAAFGDETAAHFVAGALPGFGGPAAGSPGAASLERCWKGIAEGCREALKIQPAPLAARLESCALGDEAVCRAAGRDLWDGLRNDRYDESFRPLYSPVLDFLDRRCHRGEPELCLLLADVREAGPDDIGDGGGLRAYACQQGLADACVAVVEAGLDDDLAAYARKAEALLKKPCAAHDAAACEKLERVRKVMAEFQ